jgi:Spy/CpxP family protein refolding chaperone
MRTNSLMAIAIGAFAVLAGATTRAAAQGGQQQAGAGGDACVSPLPMPPFGGRGGMGGPGHGGPPPGGRGGRGGRRGCPPFFPDSLALTAAQKQQIVSLRAGFQQAHASQFAQLKTISDSARAARQAGLPSDQVRAIMAQAKPIHEALRGPGEQVQQQVEATLTPGQLAWMQSHRPRMRTR